MNNILPCPFCGHNKFKEYLDDTHAFIRKCLSCEIQVAIRFKDYKTIDEEVNEKWNRRAKSKIVKSDNVRLKLLLQELENEKYKLERGD